MPRTESSRVLRQELEERIRSGRCAYCRRPAEPDHPLTREHVIPRARGGRRKDVRIIVPACARCNHRRGCQELIVFLLGRPRRISAFLDHLHSLSPESVQGMDLRVFADLYAAVWMLHECAGVGREWRLQLKRLCTGRTLHRRRYAARRVVGAVGGRLETIRERGGQRGGPSCPIGGSDQDEPKMQLDEPLEQLSSRLLGLLALMWEVSADDVQREMTRQLERYPSAASAGAAAGDPTSASGNEEDPELDGVLPLDRWKRRTRRRRLRVDRRRGRGRSPAQVRGRAA